MKPRKVMVHLELKTNISIKDLRNINNWMDWTWEARYSKEGFQIHQVTAQVVKPNR